jgi:DNA-directed RNA polymerase beta subunit
LKTNSVQVKLSSRHKLLALGSKIPSFSVSWWQIGFPGEVISISSDSKGAIILFVEFIGFPVNGDKFTTYHGQKGVATILPDEKMPRVSAGIADVVISSSAIIKRQTASQVMEAACGLFCVNQGIDNCTVSAREVLGMYMSQRSSSKGDPHSLICKFAEDDIKMMNSSRIYEFVRRKVWNVNSTIHEMQNVRANYGVIRIMQSVFMSSVSMSCTQQTTNKHSMSPMSKSSLGGSKRLGEMELAQLEASGFKNCLEEFVERSEACVVDACNRCRCITILCDCPEDVKAVEG